MKYFDVSQWGDSSGQGTLGTREKEILINPDTGKIYFLKYSMCKPGRDYATEYWSEIIAYEIGKYLGFNVLEYDLAEKNGRFGCISENMVDTESEQLTEGHSILTNYDASYNPEDKEMYHMYTFSFVRNALVKYGYGSFINEFINILIFDAIIGNRDRHQSNWGFVHKRNTSNQKEENERYLKKVLMHLKGGRKQKEEDLSKDVMSPIYDSGCCLGRELSEEKIRLRLKEKASFDSFIRKSVAELRRDDQPTKKCTHYELLQFVMDLDPNYKTFINNRIKEICDIYDERKLKSIVENIETGIPEKVKMRCKMSDDRKQFIIKIINTRIYKLKELVNVP